MTEVTFAWDLQQQKSYRRIRRKKGNEWGYNLQQQKSYRRIRHAEYFVEQIISTTVEILQTYQTKASWL